MVLLCARAGVPAGFHGLRRGSGERERRRECGECERASGRRREGLGVQFISGDEGRERIAEERSVLTPSMACLQGRISGESNGNSESPLTRCRNGRREVGLWSLGTASARFLLGRRGCAGRGVGRARLRSGSQVSGRCRVAAPGRARPLPGEAPRRGSRAGVAALGAGGSRGEAAGVGLARGVGVARSVGRRSPGGCAWSWEARGGEREWGQRREKSGGGWHRERRRPAPN
jgi:hypothetical protein